MAMPDLQGYPEKLCMYDPVWIRYQYCCLLKLFIWFDGC